MSKSPQGIAARRHYEYGFLNVLKAFLFDVSVERVDFGIFVLI